MSAPPSSYSPPPTLTHHPAPTLLSILPPPQIANSAVGGAHYSGVGSAQRIQRRTSAEQPPPSLRTDDERASRARIMHDLRELYCCRPAQEIFARTWRRDALFEDPLVKCCGYEEYAPQWFAMPKLFSKSETLSSRVMLSTRSPNRLIYSQSQEYTLRITGANKRVDSVITVDLDEDDKIVRVEDKWNGEEAPTRYGALFLRRLNARVARWLISTPKWQS